MTRYLIPLIILSNLLFTASQPATAQTAERRPMIMPAAGEPDPATWMFGQAYGNTTGAYNFGDRWYRAGQGLHFGIDLAMPCGTPLVAVADGVVQFVDDRGFGSMPHNLIIRHEALGVTTLYGHLLNTPTVMPGQLVTQGEVIARSGDPDETCDSRPHLHFEVRSLDYSRTLNPSPLIDAQWHSLSLIGPYSFPLFQHDLTNPRRWVSVEDQPDVYFWGGILNQYTTTYPAGFGQRPTENPIPARNAAPLPDDTTYITRRMTEPGCCALPMWDAMDPNTFYIMDGPPGSVASVYRWDATTPEAGGTLTRPAPVPYLSPLGSYELQPFINGTAKVRGESLDVNVTTGGRIPTANITENALLWADSDDVAVPGQQRPVTRVYISQITGENPREIFAAPGADARWLDDNRVLLSVRNEQRETQLLIYDLPANSITELGTWREMRGLSTSPGGRYIAFYLSWQTDPTANGVYMIDTATSYSAQEMPWFGAWRWRDNTTLYYIPFEPDATHHTLRLYDLTTTEDRLLASPQTAPFTIANGHWEVSADGATILYQDAQDGATHILYPQETNS